jgi:hypothetical protein
MNLFRIRPLSILLPMVRLLRVDILENTQQVGKDEQWGEMASPNLSFFQGKGFVSEGLQCSSMYRDMPMSPLFHLLLGIGN